MASEHKSPDSSFIPHPSSLPSQDVPVSPRILWFSQLGGAVAWVLHLTGSYSVGEWGCASPFARDQFLSLTGPVWLLFVVTATAMALALAAAWTGHRAEAELRAKERFPGRVGETRHPGIYMARSGLMTSGLFAFIILVQSVPTFYFLRSC